MVKNTKPIECPSCGAYLGEAVPGYLQSAQCFCGEIVVIPTPTRKDLETAEELPPLAIAS